MRVISREVLLSAGDGLSWNNSTNKLEVTQGSGSYFSQMGVNLDYPLGGLTVGGTVTSSEGNSGLWQTAYDQRGEVIAGHGLIWSNDSLNLGGYSEGFEMITDKDVSAIFNGFTQFRLEVQEVRFVPPTISNNSSIIFDTGNGGDFQALTSHGSLALQGAGLTLTDLRSAGAGLAICW